jgi:hypothetical protein
MLDHVIVTVSEFTRSIAFYAQALKPLAWSSAASTIRLACASAGNRSSAGPAMIASNCLQSASRAARGSA